MLDKWFKYCYWKVYKVERKLSLAIHIYIFYFIVMWIHDAPIVYCSFIVL